MNVIAIDQCIFQTLQHNDAKTVSAHSARCLGAECSAMSIGRKNAALLVEIADGLRYGDANTTG